jgi:hypothetical protein
MRKVASIKPLSEMAEAVVGAKTLRTLGIAL